MTRQEKNYMPIEDGLAGVASQKLTRLTTRGRTSGKLHTVTVWFAVGKGVVFLSHEGKETDWMKNIKRNPQVTLEISGKRFSGKARHLVDNTNEAWSAKTALYEKYYGKATKAVIEDWFSLSKLVMVEMRD